MNHSRTGDNHLFASARKGGWRTRRRKDKSEFWRTSNIFGERHHLNYLPRRGDRRELGKKQSFDSLQSVIPGPLEKQDFRKGVW